MPSLSQTRAIQTLRRKAGLEDEDYRALLMREAGVASSTKLDQRGAFRVIETLKKLAGLGTTAALAANRSRATTATGRFAPILQALWIAGHNLGVVRSKDDAALIAFVQRQAKVTHTEFLVDPAQAKRAIEALKDWLARESGVEWPVEKNSDPDFGGVRRKRAVTEAIARRLVETGGFTPFAEHLAAWPGDFELYAYRLGFPAAFSSYEGQHWDRLANRLGARLRATLAKKSRTVPKTEAA